MNGKLLKRLNESTPDIIKKLLSKQIRAKVINNKVFNNTMIELENFKSLTVDEKSNVHLEKLKSILIHAYENTIYYKKLFKPETQYLYSVLWNKVFRGDIIRKYRIRFRNDIKICEDWTFILDYLDCIDSIYISDCNFYQYSQDNFNSLVKKKRIRSFIKKSMGRF